MKKVVCIGSFPRETRKAQLRQWLRSSCDAALELPSLCSNNMLLFLPDNKNIIPGHCAMKSLEFL